MSLFCLALLLAAPAASQPLVATWQRHSDEVTSAEFTPDGNRVVSSSDDGTLMLWDVATGKPLGTWEGHEAEIGAMALTPDGKTALSGGDDLTLRVWDVSTGRESGIFKEHEEQTRAIALSPDGHTAATVSWDRELKLWDIPSRTLIAALETGVEAKALHAAFSPDGKRLLAARRDKTIAVWDVPSRKQTATWKGHKNQVLAVAFSPDGKKVLSGSRDNTLRLWDAATGRMLAVWEGHTSFVNTVAFSPDGRTALSGGTDFTLRLWDVAQGRVLGVWWGHQGAILDIAFSPNGRLAVSASEDGTLKLWDISGETIASEELPTFNLPPGPGGPQARLGKVLFFDQRLSGDSSRDCAFCHMPERAFSDGRALSIGYPETLYFRNTPTLLDAFSETLPAFLDGHITEPYFMNTDKRLLVEKLRQAPGYVQAFAQGFQKPPNYPDALAALAAFIGTLKSGQSPFDQDALTPAARRGHTFFMGEAGCAQCHSGPLFSDGLRHDRGVKDNPAIFLDPLRHVSFRRYFKRLGAADYASLKSDAGPFRTPSLRDVARTGPYMHNGMLSTLREAVAFEGPGLEADMQNDIVEFLKSLSEPSRALTPPDLPAYGVLPLRAKAVSRKGAAEEPHAPYPKLDTLPPVPAPKDDSPTPEKSALGELLFFEHRLSGDGESFCAACHVPAMGWDDNSDLAQGYERTLHWRNAPTLLNAAYKTRLGWDGAHTRLEDHIRSAIASNVVMHGDPMMIEERLAQSPEYISLFQKAFGTARPRFEDVLRALASFLRTVPLSRDAPFDAFIRGDTAALSVSARKGMELFHGKAGCIRCHNGPLATDESFHAIGPPRNAAFDHIALRQITLRYSQALQGLEESEYREQDPGLYLLTHREEDIGKFLTPSLRELEHTAPYMHNGVLPTLEDVVAFYDQGGGEATNKSPLLKPLKLTPQEKEDLTAFLRSLSGGEVLVEPAQKIGARQSTIRYWK